MLDVHDVCAGYGGMSILHEVSIAVKEGEIACLLGPNGSGKSTLAKVVIGLLKPSVGKILLNGEDITGWVTGDILRKGICLVPQGRIVFPYMSVLENLRMGGYTLREKEVLEDRIEEAYDLFPVLRSRRNEMSRNLSGGEQTMLCIARSTLLRPQLLILDEPSLGLSPKYVGMVYDKIVELKENGMTMLIIEQNVRRALSVASHAFILDLGRNRFEGSTEDLKKRIDLAELYLGRES